MPLPTPAHSPTHYSLLGGAAQVRRLVDAFYDHMDRDAPAQTLRALHPADLAPLREALVLYLCEWLGGPADFTAQRGEPRLRKRHAHLVISAADSAAWLDCMRSALADVAAPAALQPTLLAGFADIARRLQTVGSVAHCGTSSPLPPPHLTEGNHHDCHAGTHCT